jgi:opacity protein-like surface antigen
MKKNALAVLLFLLGGASQAADVLQPKADTGFPSIEKSASVSPDPSSPILLAQYGYIWTCYARSNTGAVGWGAHENKSAAEGIAINYCYGNSPYGATCWITSCN